MSEAIIGILHNEPVPPGHAFSEASLDVLTQAEAIETALEDLGCSSTRIPFTRDLSAFLQRMAAEKVEMAFNLCETVGEDPRFAGHPAAVLELMGIPFSGSPSMAIMLTTDKLMTKRLLRAKGIRSPNYLAYNGAVAFHAEALRFPVIVKPRFQDASIGIDQESVFRNGEELHGRIGELFARFGTLLVEEYIAGREFNISLLGHPSASALPAAEIDFSGFPEDLFPIVGYRAKWDTSSVEYRHTTRRFSEDLPHALRRDLEQTAIECFRLFMLRDYGRVDVRVDNAGHVHVLEINANPCLSLDAGFAAAAERAGINYSKMVGQFLDFMIQRSHEHDYQAYRLSGQR